MAPTPQAPVKHPGSTPPANDAVRARVPHPQSTVSGPRWTTHGDGYIIAAPFLEAGQTGQT